ncbi:MAG: alpha/beta fold hydrolase [Patescibacteria group bacterium]
MAVPRQPEAYFKGHGYAVRVVPYHFFDMGNVRDYARNIVEQVDKEYNSNGRHRVVLIGYSLGGLASLYALKRFGLAGKVSTFIAVGAPFHGSELALLAIPTGVWTVMGLQASPCSPFHRDLHADPLPAGTKFVSISGKRDDVCPASTNYLKGAVNVSLDYGHSSFFADSAIFPIMETYF